MTDKWEEAMRGKPATVVTTVATDRASPADPSEGGYRPWGREHTGDDDVIEVRLKSGEWRQVFRPYLVAIEGVGDTMLSLLCTSYAVTLEGRNLAELRTLIRSRGIDFIEEFDPKRWREPGEGVPRIDRVQIVAQGRATRSGPEPSVRR